MPWRASIHTTRTCKFNHHYSIVLFYYAGCCFRRVVYPRRYKDAPVPKDYSVVTVHDDQMRLEDENRPEIHGSTGSSQSNLKAC